MLASAPTASHSVQAARSAARSSRVRSRLRRALINWSKLVVANGIFDTWNTLVPRLAIFCST